MKRTRGRLLIPGLLLLALLAGGTLVWLLQGRGGSVAGSINVVQPSADEIRTFAGTRVFFGHQSVGANVISGVEAIYASSEVPLQIVQARQPESGGDGFLAHARMGVNGDPLGKFADFTAVLDGPLGNQVDVAVLKLCYVDVVAGTDVEALFDRYVSMMDDLERAHPSVRFIYATAPLTTDRGWKSTVRSWLGQDDRMGPADNVARQRYNELIRQRYSGTGRLFDVAAIEATMAGAPTQRQLDGEPYFVLNGALATDPGHLNELGSALAGAEFIRVVSAASTQP